MQRFLVNVHQTCEREYRLLNALVLRGTRWTFPSTVAWHHTSLNVVGPRAGGATTRAAPTAAATADDTSRIPTPQMALLHLVNHSAELERHQVDALVGFLGIHDGLDTTRTKSPLRRRGAPQPGLTYRLAVSDPASNLDPCPQQVKNWTITTAKF